MPAHPVRPDTHAEATSAASSAPATVHGQPRTDGRHPRMRLEAAARKPMANPSLGKKSVSRRKSLTEAEPSAALVGQPTAEDAMRWLTAYAVRHLPGVEAASLT